MITGGGSKQQELLFLTLKKKILNFSSHSLHPLHRYLQAIGRRIQAFGPVCTLWAREKKGGCQRGCLIPTFFGWGCRLSLWSDSGLVGCGDRSPGQLSGRAMNSTFRPETAFCALMGIIVTELSICDYEILDRLERFTQIIPLQDTASFNRGISLWIEVLETNTLVSVL